MNIHLLSIYLVTSLGYPCARRTAIDTTRIELTYAGGTAGITDTTLGILEAVGFFGANRTGKTTTITVLVIPLKPTDGTVTVNGVDVVTEPASGFDGGM
ncbi:hypothetical protein [Natrialba asiatica]|uniref:Daunorubicin resistance ABC transporter ATPase n=1 Tax=Natrialba asiatica (strain ATCC 700177 / DSM 12278 / JCM 9576 / FERM P-10747 / NBRC 102637 / 172P1) TaxID=29540 RepID=M0AHG2_NATA1|nr:hypothetical protein [Natrialba asiatica]ELY97984.1 daunorubicin resistance ABC transporter ATPase [Natrialba asiatica DSM 12278]